MTSCTALYRKHPHRKHPHRKHPHGKHSQRRQAGGFTLIEILVVIVILSLLMAYLLPKITSGTNAAKQMACQSNMRQNFYAPMQAYKVSHSGKLPKPSGIHMLWALWKSGVIEHTEKNMEKFFCPGVEHGGEEDRMEELKALGVDNIWKVREDFTSLDTDYAVIARRKKMDSGRTPWMADDNEFGNNHPNGINILYGDGTAKFLSRDQDLKEWWDEEDPDFVFPVGPNSPHPDLQKLTNGSGS